MGTTGPTDIVVRVPRVSRWRWARDYPRLRRDPLGPLSDWLRRYGPIFQFPTARPVVVLSDPADVRHVLVANAAQYPKGGNFELTRETLGEGLVTSNGPWHDLQRRRLLPLFQKGRLSDLPDLTRETAERVTASWRDGDAVNVVGAMSRIALTVAGGALFKVDLLDRAEGIAEAYLAGQRYMAAGAFAPWRGWSRWFRRRSFRRATAALVALGEDLIEATGSGAPATPFVEALRTATDETDRPVARKRVRDECLTFLAAAHETVATALTWTVRSIAERPDLHRALAREADAGEAGPFSLAQRSLREAMRLWPPVWCLGRRVEAADRLPSGVALPAGAHVVIFPHLLSRSPDYFPEPDRFDPDRFTEKRAREIPPGVYFPFGAGARSCLGEAFAMAEMSALLVHLFQRFSFERFAEPPRPEWLVTLWPGGGMRTRATRRPVSGSVRSNGDRKIGESPRAQTSG